jgi:hypothetical protein
MPARFTNEPLKEVWLRLTGCLHFTAYAVKTEVKCLTVPLMVTILIIIPARITRKRMEENRKMILAQRLNQR